MAEAKKEYGVVGLGRMGGNLARQALEKGIRAVGFTRKGAPADLVETELVEVCSFKSLKAELSPPRAVFLYIPVGPAVDSVLEDLASQLEDVGRATMTYPSRGVLASLKLVALPLRRRQCRTLVTNQ